MSHIDIKHLKTLVALRDCGSVIDAAQHLHLTQSALSHQIKDLEDKLGCSLFIRKTKPVRFTSAGLRLLTLADDTLPMVAAATRDIARLADGKAGRLHLAIECHSCFQWLMPTLDIFRDNWPEVELDILSGFSFAPLPALARGDLDLVVTSDPLSTRGIVYSPLFRYQVMLAVNNQHPLIANDYIKPADLTQEILITYPVERSRLDVFSQFLDLDDSEPQQVRTTELTVMMLQLVASGKGVCALPNWALAEYIAKDYITAKPLGPNGVWSTLYAGVREEQIDQGYLKDFIDTAIATSFKHLADIEAV